MKATPRLRRRATAAAALAAENLEFPRAFPRSLPRAVRSLGLENRVEEGCHERSSVEKCPKNRPPHGPGAPALGLRERRLCRRGQRAADRQRGTLRKREFVPGPAGSRRVAGKLHRIAGGGTPLV